MATARPTNAPSDIPGLRNRALQSVFPGLTGGPSPTGPATPANTRDFAMRAPTPNHLSAAARAAQAVAAHLAANPVRPATPYVAPTRANTPATQSAGTINTNYVNSAQTQGVNGVTPPNIYAPARNTVLPGLAHPRNFYQNQIFIPTAPRANQPLFSPPPVPAPTPMVPNPQPVFPPRNNFLNILFPSQ